MWSLPGTTDLRGLFYNESYLVNLFLVFWVIKGTTGLVGIGVCSTAVGEGKALAIYSSSNLLILIFPPAVLVLRGFDLGELTDS